MNLLRILLFFVLISFGFYSCTQVDLYEKNATIPQFKWKSSYSPEFSFTIKDTTAQYELFLVLRHNEKYNYNNIWLNIYMQAPGDSMRKISVEEQLASNEHGWFATAMDDIYEHRISLNKELVNNNFSFRKAGDYHFKIEQIMREDPLQNVMNIGLRIEKKP
jgi:gliding motility-associated lipoprotein GldH